MARRKKKLGFGGVLLLLVLAALVYFVYPRLAPDDSSQSKQPAAPITQPASEMQVHVIDVGQGDAILLTTPDGHMLIDAGDNVGRYESALKDYLDGLGITELEYFVVSHVHADHIGGADMVLTNYKVNNVVMTDAVATTGVFESMLDAIEASDANVIEAIAGASFSLGELSCKILAPLDDYSNTNDQSIVLRATYGGVSMLFTGDAEGNLEGKSEKDILATYGADELPCDFYKVGHHGSDTSSSPALLAAVRPKLAAISCGEGNKYGHPIQSTLDALEAVGATVYRTDLEGDLVFSCDGESIWYVK
jgi:beta-lactamase superfamily II metal-dependent hydrolase